MAVATRTRIEMSMARWPSATPMQLATSMPTAPARAMTAPYSCEATDIPSTTSPKMMSATHARSVQDRSAVFDARDENEIGRLPPAADEVVVGVDEQGVAGAQDDLPDLLLQLLAAAMDGDDRRVVPLPEIGVLDALPDEGRGGGDDHLAQQPSRPRRGDRRRGQAFQRIERVEVLVPVLGQQRCAVLDRIEPADPLQVDDRLGHARKAQDVADADDLVRRDRARSWPSRARCGTGTAPADRAARRPGP